MREYHAYYTSNEVITVKALSLEEAKSKVPAESQSHSAARLAIFDA